MLYLGMVITLYCVELYSEGEVSSIPLTLDVPAVSTALCDNSPHSIHGGPVSI